MVARSSGFFRAPVNEAQKQGGGYEYINVGGEQFHAAAVALIDYLHSDLPASDATLKKILGSFYHYFPQYISNDAYLTPKERMGRLLSNSRKSELVECMAYVVRQLTVDELYADYLNLAYRDVFAPLSADTPKSHLRDMETPLPPCALNALEQSLQIPIALSWVQSDKVLRNSGGVVQNERAALVLQDQGDGFYCPGVKRKTDFAYVGQLAITVKPIVSVKEQEGVMADIVNAIAEENRNLLQEYIKQRNMLLNVIADGELSYEQLRTLYTAFYPMQEHNAAFITQLEPKTHPVDARAPLNSEQWNIKSRCGALASWVVAGVVSQDHLFEKIENLERKSSLAN